MANPLVHFDLFNQPRTEPHVSGFVQLDTTEPAQSDPVNDLVILSPFRSGKPGVLVTHRSILSIANLHDPGNNEDQGVALARMAKDAFSDRDVFGAGVIRTLRVDPATNAACLLKASAVDLIRIARNDYGSHTNGPGVTVGAGTHVGKKITLNEPLGRIVGDDLGECLHIQYVGNGSAATLTIVTAVGVISYSIQPNDADKVTVNGKVFEFDSDTSVAGGSVAVTIGASVDATYANLAAAILANVSGVTVTHDAANNRVTVSGPEVGVVLQETSDTASGYTIAHLPPAARLRTTLTSPSDGSQNLDIPLTLSAYKSIDRLASYIGRQLGYTCTVSTYANKFLLSTGLDIVSAVNIKPAPVQLMGLVAAIVDFVNQHTRGLYTATELARSTPDDQTVVFSGGTTPTVTAVHWEAALNVLGAGTERGAVVLVDTDDPAIFAMCAAFVEEQRALGKWFRFFFGAQPGLITNGLDTSAYDTIAASIDSERCRLAVQRVGIFRADAGNAIEYLHPVFTAAALAGGAAGNRPYVKPLTNKRLRTAGIHPDDSYVLEAREDLLSAGITVLKREEDRVVVVLGVTTSRDPDRRMARIMSEIDTVDMVDAAVRQAFLPLRGQWGSKAIVGRVKGILQRVLQRFVDDGALVAGLSPEGEHIPAFRFVGDPPYTIEAGVVKVNYQIFIGSEINHIDLLGRASYARLVGEISGGVVDLSTPVPL